MYPLVKTVLIILFTSLLLVSSVLWPSPKQACPLLSHILILVMLSASHLHLVESIAVFKPTSNVPWMTASGLSILMGILLSVRSFGCFWNLLESLCSGCAVLLFAETLKYSWRKRVQVAQRRAKLEFNTRLGMHSPR